MSTNWPTSARAKLGLLLLLGVTLWFPTGGVVITSRDEAVTGYCMEDTHRSINLFVSYGVRQRGIPLLFLCIADGPSLYISLSYTTSNIEPGSVLRFDELRILSVDGREIDLRDRIPNSIVLVPQEEPTWDGPRPEGVRRYLGAEANCGELGDVRKGFSVRIKARVFSVDNVVDTVDVTITPVFHKKREWHSGWNWYFNM
jgi:hypothetical protein